MAEDEAVGQTTEKRGAGVYILLILASVAIYAWLFAMMYSNDLYNSLNFLNFTRESLTSMKGALFLMLPLAMVVIVMIVRGPSGVTAVEAEEVYSEPSEDAQEEPPAEEAPVTGDVVEWPSRITGAIYGDVSIPLGNGDALKLRTLLARSCLLCDNQGKCWEEWRDSLQMDDFLANADCKQGLKRLAAGE